MAVQLKPNWLYSIGPSLTRLDLANGENMLLFVSSEAVESKRVKVKTNSTVKFPPTVSILWCNLQNRKLLRKKIVATLVIGQNLSVAKAKPMTSAN